MKRVDTTTTTKRNFDELISQFSKDEYLICMQLNHVRGGDGEGNGSEPIIIIPPTNG